jgi:hypothetical protein
MAQHITLRVREVRAEILGHVTRATCQWCGVTFRTGGGPSQHPYCSASCRWTAEEGAARPGVSDP